MAVDDDTLDDALDDGNVAVRPPRLVLSFFRALATLGGYCEQLRRALAISDGAAVERAASDAVYWWLVATAVAQQLQHPRGESSNYVESVLGAVAAESRKLSTLFRIAARTVRSKQARRALVQHRLVWRMSAMAWPSHGGRNLLSKELTNEPAGS